MTLNHEQIKLRNHILQSVIARVDALYGKPKTSRMAGTKREEAALNYIVGATKVLELLDNQLSQYFQKMIVMVFCVRGTYAEAHSILLAYNGSEEAA